MNHQTSFIGRLVVDIKSFYAEATFVAISMLFGHKKPTQRGASTPWAVTEPGTFVSAPSTRSVHDIGTCNDFPLMKVPNKEPWRSRWDTKVYEQGIMLVHVVTFGKG